MPDALQFFSHENAHAEYRPVGEYTFDEAVDMIDAAIAHCKAKDIRCLLVDIRGVSGFPPPSTIQRFQFATKWSSTAASRVAISLIAPPELIDSDHIGVTMASNRGLRSDVFTTEPEALAWLRTTCS